MLEQTSRSTWPARLLPFVGAAVVAAALTGQVMLLLGQSIPYFMSDFLVYRGGGHAVLHDVRVYQIGVLTPVSQNMQFIYTPFAAVVLAPLAALGVGASETLWTFLSLLAIAATIWLSLRISGVCSRRLLTAGTVGGMFVASLLSPVSFNLILGQINVFVMLLILLDFAPGTPERWRGAGIGVAAGLKLTPLLFVAYLVLTKRWAAAWRSVVAFAATILLGFAVIPTDSRAYWLHGMFHDTSRMVPFPTLVNHSLPGLIARLHHTATPSNGALAIATVVGVVFLAGAVWAYRRGQDTVGMLVIAFTAQLVSPITWMHHGVWVIPALIWLGLTRWRSGTLVPWVVLSLATAWYMAPIWLIGQGSLTARAPHQWTTSGEIITALTGNLVPAVIAIMLMPVWLPRLRELAKEESGVEEPTKAPD